MDRMLILTKNMMVEKSLQERLQLMNYEVLCHQNTTIDAIATINGPSLLDFFDCLIISETISQEIYQEVLNKLRLQERHLPVLRKSELTNQAGEKDDFESTLLPIDASFEVIREILANVIGYQPSDPHEETKDLMLHRLEHIQWTNKEYRLFNLLREEAGECVEREGLCIELWGTYNNSSKAQLSTIIKHMRIKLEAAGISGEYLLTLWGRGYKLDKLFKLVP